MVAKMIANVIAKVVAKMVAKMFAKMVAKTVAKMVAKMVAKIQSSIFFILLFHLCAANQRHHESVIKPAPRLRRGWRWLTYIDEREREEGKNCRLQQKRDAEGLLSSG
uniref:Secreted protein n=1 Tax=Knipowitschia caucasica TaxID=637954 RepID=A0AAV2KPW0_KNICA